MYRSVAPLFFKEMYVVFGRMGQQRDAPGEVVDALRDHLTPGAPCGNP
jgi:hypothetical protein